MKKKWVLTAVGLVVVTAAVVAAKSRSNGDEKPKESPFRLGKVQTSDLQVSVREVGVVDPVNKVEVKSTVSGRVVALHAREGDKVKRGDLLAEVEPDVTQAQSLSEVTTAVTQAELKLRDAERALGAQQRLFDNGLLGKESLADFETTRAQCIHQRLCISRAHTPYKDTACQCDKSTDPKNLLNRESFICNDQQHAGKHHANL